MYVVEFTKPFKDAKPTIKKGQRALLDEHRYNFHINNVKLLKKVSVVDSPYTESKLMEASENLDNKAFLAMEEVIEKINKEKARLERKLAFLKGGFMFMNNNKEYHDKLYSSSSTSV